jgi:predicted transcriptional regulator
MTERRPMGSVEADVLQELWAGGDFAAPADIRDALDYDLAYSTVNTILVRLWKKGLVERRRGGRSFVYRAQLGEDELTATRMHEQLARAQDRDAALSRFVDTLTKRELAALRRRLGTGR